MKISVIIPVKNRAHLIAETLDSILAQTFLPAEIILVDDDSTDNLVQAIESYKDKVIYTKSLGKGPGAARNTGLKYAKGEAIQFFDSDDIMSVNKLEVQVDILNRNKDIGVVLGPYVAAEKKQDKWIQTDVVMQYKALPNRPLCDIVAAGWCSITQACLFSRDLIDRAGPWREDLMTHEDKDYWFRIGLLISYPAHENKSLTIYRQHEQQITDGLTAAIERTENGIKVFADILQHREGHISFLSKSVLKGIIVNYKKYCIMHGKQYTFHFSDHIYGLIAKAYAKIGRIKTGTDWQPMHGVNTDHDIFKMSHKLF